MAKDLTAAATGIHGLTGRLAPSFLLFSLLLFTGAASAETAHKIYFQNTDYELHVYEIRGDYPGNTILIIGGMHNEPGGYLSADLYADMSLHQGNLIVVPRANFPVIVNNNRQIHSDMNRKFTNGTSESRKTNYEESVVNILKQLMAKSNVLLNLHDGSGFYRPNYQSKLRNPSRWGQSIITDTDTYVTPMGRTLLLKERTERVLSRINPHIRNPEHRFHLNNTRTFDADSPHKEQRGSATFYALTEYGIESYGVETSKSIASLDLKVRYQAMIINAFMEEFAVLPNNPKVAIKDPELQYLLVSVNGSFPYGIPNHQTLHVNPGDNIRIEHIAANYERGLVADIKGLGSLNDLNKEFTIEKPHTILVKKDQFECGKIYVSLDRKKEPLHPAASWPAPTKRPGSSDEKEKRLVEAFLVQINDREIRVPAGHTFEISTGDKLILRDITPVTEDYKKIKVNFVGFVGNKTVNDAEDRGYSIHPHALWKRFSLDKKGGLYRIEATLKDKPVAKIYLRIRGAAKLP